MIYPVDAVHVWPVLILCGAATALAWGGKNAHDGVDVRAESEIGRRKAGCYETDCLAARASCCHRGSPRATHARDGARWHITCRDGCRGVDINGSPGRKYLSGMAWDKANFQILVGSITRLQPYTGYHTETLSDCQVEMPPRIQTQTQTQTRHPRIHGLAQKDVPRRRPFTVVHATASRLSLPETTTWRFFPYLEQGVKKKPSL